MWIRAILLFVVVWLSVAPAHGESWKLSPRAWVGQVFSVKGPWQAAQQLTVQFRGKKIPVYQAKGKSVAIVPIPLGSPIGFNKVKIVREDGTIAKTLSIRVLPKKYPRYSFRIASEKRILRNRAIAKEEWTEIEPILTGSTLHRYWTSSFARPVPGIVTQRFGTSHYVNGLKGTTHSGVDLRARVGTRVGAANAGVVRLASHFRAYGGTVVIDHGQGVYSFYFHLSKILARAGSMVKRGQSIGRSGNTGISTGPHLHWGISVHNVRVEPLQWTSQVF